ncbi:hypothetical protein DMO16_01380 [Fictibacillus sp. S7]|nr:hypothetical protein DMO16_01380 [Fictibacillus sp. S7]
MGDAILFLWKNGSGETLDGLRKGYFHRVHAKAYCGCFSSGRAEDKNWKILFRQYGLTLDGPNQR